MSNRSCSPRALLLLGLLATSCAMSGKTSPGAEPSTQTAPQGAQEERGAAAMLDHFPTLEKRPSGLEVVARLEQTPGNIAITPEGRIFLSQHPFGAPKYAVVELLPGGTTRPYPTEQWASAPGPDGTGLQTVIGLESDKNGVLWILDNGKGGGEGAKLVGWDTRGEKLVKTIPLPKPVAASNSFLQDLVVDPDRGVAVLADMGRGDLVGESMPALVVVDLKSGQGRRVLQGHPSLQPEDVPMVVEGRHITVADKQGKQVEPRLGLNPIALDPKGEWLYFGSMNGRTVWRVRMDDVLDPKLSTEELGQKVKPYGQKAVSDGMSIDSVGNLYITDLGAGAIGVTRPDDPYELYVKDELLQWPDGLTYGPDGYFYVTVNQLHRHAALNQGKSATRPPFLVVRFKPLAPSAVGR
ncbi:L-dopachrome tautomerase-related protein [Vitiosangium sp. GDMCC 1.1324]|uniref:L-dopachrome tautomerase-related protein n=1 Tax=Vitiosangium sp. (strain GDMCC 1.1324) TaxID=2138576 RepID=UPI00130E1E7E|nr:L-dopachrome tautomerase-related protein [Vitiosangium sp. GDMCC 1.1324]